MRHARLLAVAGAGVLAVGLSACSKSDDPAAPGHEATVAATDTACTIAQGELSAGVVKFSITNSGSKITEFYVFSGDRAVGEVENISPSTTRTLSVELKAGTYEGVCKPGMVGDGIKAPFTVSGTAGGAERGPEARRRGRQLQGLRAEPGGDPAGPRPSSSPTRSGPATWPRPRRSSRSPGAPYEAIEPVAESFGDLDPAIDARDGDLEPGVEWTGFHALEQHLWVTGDISKDKALADKLDADVAKLVDLVKTVELKPLEIANGAKELLDEVATSKITGEEDRYSHTDLWDFAANVAGAKAAVDTLRPALSERDAALMSDVDAKFAAVQALLDKQKVGDGYTALRQADPGRDQGPGRRGQRPGRADQ